MAKGVMGRPKRSVAVIQANLAAYSREPFIEILARFVGAAPTLASILDFAQKSPDKWANSVRALAQVAGYTDKIDITNNVFMQIHTMSDVELMSQLSRLKPILDLTAEPSRSGQNSAGSNTALIQDKTNTDTIQAEGHEKSPGLPE